MGYGRQVLRQTSVPGDPGAEALDDPTARDDGKADMSAGYVHHVDADRARIGDRWPAEPPSAWARATNGHRAREAFNNSPAEIISCSDIVFGPSTWLMPSAEMQDRFGSGIPSLRQAGGSG